MFIVGFVLILKQQISDKGMFSNNKKYRLYGFLYHSSIPVDK
jgi:hypothetical protein